MLALGTLGRRLRCRLGRMRAQITLCERFDAAHREPDDILQLTLSIGLLGRPANGYCYLTHAHSRRATALFRLVVVVLLLFFRVVVHHLLLRRREAIERRVGFVLVGGHIQIGFHRGERRGHNAGNSGEARNRARSELRQREHNLATACLVKLDGVVALRAHTLGTLAPSAQRARGLRHCHPHPRAGSTRHRPNGPVRKGVEIGGRWSHAQVGQSCDRSSGRSDRGGGGRRLQPLLLRSRGWTLVCGGKRFEQARR
mmetsp:Transcript_10933/g.28018  ORF Transcript_10933/g.28018 Transcript_10933/m.28018 type:complete len:256 (-) Transcript_10933:1027-1794(-)